MAEGKRISRIPSPREADLIHEDTIYPEKIEYNPLVIEKEMPCSPKGGSIVLSFAKNIKVGADLMEIQAPIWVDCGKSTLEMQGDSYRPTRPLMEFIKEADPAIRMLHLLNHIMHSMSQYIRFRLDHTKPFNPILGERFLATWDMKDRSAFHLISEQVSHHPPICAYKVVNEKHNFVGEGSYETKMVFKGNHVDMTFKGSRFYHHKNPESKKVEHYHQVGPYSQVKGVFLGDVEFGMTHKAVLTCKETETIGVINFLSDHRVKFKVKQKKHPTSKTHDLKVYRGAGSLLEALTVTHLAPSNYEENGGFSDIESDSEDEADQNDEQKPAKGKSKSHESLKERIARKKRERAERRAKRKKAKAIKKIKKKAHKVKKKRLKALKKEGMDELLAEKIAQKAYLKYIEDQEHIVNNLEEHKQAEKKKPSDQYSSKKPNSISSGKSTKDASKAVSKDEEAKTDDKNLSDKVDSKSEMTPSTSKSASSSSIDTDSDEEEENLDSNDDDHNTLDISVGGSDTIMELARVNAFQRRRRPVAMQHPLESRRVWHNVAYAISKGDEELARQEKHIVEETQRRKRADRKRNGKSWKPAFFYDVGKPDEYGERPYFLLSEDGDQAFKEYISHNSRSSKNDPDFIVEDSDLD